jgi:iduronate 2-sulfatase
MKFREHAAHSELGRTVIVVRFLVNLSMLTLMFVVASGTLAGTEKPNVLFIAIDDLRNDLGALGVVHARTPHLDAFATSARLFTHHFTQIPTCGASRASLLRGRYPTVAAHLANSAILATHADWAAESLPAVFGRHGYITLALGKVTHYPGGRTGRNWAEGPEELPGVWSRSWIPGSPWRHAEGMMHGYAGGQPRLAGKSPAIEEFDGPDEAYPDAWVAEEAIRTLEGLADEKRPWFMAVGFFKPHLPFAAPKRYFDMHEADGIPALMTAVAARRDWHSGWHRSGEFRGNYAHGGRDPATDAEYARQLRRAYAASVSYVDAQAGRVLTALRAAGLEDNTIIVVWSDHGFLLGEHAIWGKHCLYERALRSPLMIRHPRLPQPGKTSAAIVETVDIFPTLADLCGLLAPGELDGRSLRPQLENPSTPSLKPAFGFWTGGRRTVRSERWRLIVQSGKDVGSPRIELFDYQADPDETRNHAAERPGVVREMLDLIEHAPRPEADQ